MNVCSNCQYGPYSKLSDWCDECRNEPDTGWYGFTDNYLGKHFYSERERQDYINKYGDYPVEEDDGYIQIW